MPAGAHWIEFEACGRRETGITAESYAFAEAPNLGRVFVWASPGIVVVELRVPKGEKVCTGMSIGAYRYIVVGDYESVICKLTPKAPYCKE